MAEDPEGAIFHKFDCLSARNLLYLQSNLNELRVKLDAVDRIDTERCLRDTRVRLSAKAYSDQKAKARWYQEDRGAIRPNLVETAAAHSEQNAIGADAFERLGLHQQIRDAIQALPF